MEEEIARFSLVGWITGSCAGGTAGTFFIYLYFGPVAPAGLGGLLPARLGVLVGCIAVGGAIGNWLGLRVRKNKEKRFNP